MQTGRQSPPSSYAATRQQMQPPPTPSASQSHPPPRRGTIHRALFLFPANSPVISNGASRRFLFPPRSCGVVGLRREKSLFVVCRLRRNTRFAIARLVAMKSLFVFRLVKAQCFLTARILCDEIPHLRVPAVHASQSEFPAPALPKSPSTTNVSAPTSHNRQNRGISQLHPSRPPHRHFERSEKSLFVLPRHPAVTRKQPANHG